MDVHPVALFFIALFVSLCATITICFPVVTIFLRVFGLGVEKKNDERRVQPKYAADSGSGSLLRAHKDEESQDDCGSPESGREKENVEGAAASSDSLASSRGKEDLASLRRSLGTEDARDVKQDATSNFLSVTPSAETAERPIVELSSCSRDSAGGLDLAVDSPRSDCMEKAVPALAADPHESTPKESRVFDCPPRVRESLDKLDKSMEGFHPPAPDTAMPAAPESQPQEIGHPATSEECRESPGSKKRISLPPLENPPQITLTRETDTSLEKEMTGQSAAAPPSRKTLLRNTTANFQKILNEVAVAAPGSEELDFWSRRARIDTVFFNKLLDEVAPVAYVEESKSGAAASSAPQRSNSWHARQPVEDSWALFEDHSSELPGNGIVLRGTSGLVRAKTFDRDPQCTVTDTGGEVAQSSDTKSAWDEDVDARGKLLRASTARFNQVLEEVSQADPGSKEFQSAAEKARMVADEFHNLLDQVAPAPDADAQQGRLQPSSPRSPRKRSWPIQPSRTLTSQNGPPQRPLDIQHLPSR